MKEEIIKILKEHYNDYLSGQKISGLLGVTRAAIWKYMNILKEEGYTIEASSKKGYKLVASPDILTYEEVSPFLKTVCIGRNIIHYETIDSTNTMAKVLASKGENEGTVIISEEQTAGKGRLGREWISPKFKGIWLSIILKPELDPIHVSKVTLVGAAAVFKALIELGISAQIKWPNDLVLNNKKICGILTEMSAELNKVHYIVMGIGINANLDLEDFPEDLRNKATSINLEIGIQISRQELTSRILNNFEVLYDEFLKTNSIKSSVEICKNNSIFLGKEIKIIQFSSEIIATAIDITNEGQLIVKHKNGQIETIVSGEVTMKGLYGYTEDAE